MCGLPRIPYVLESMGYFLPLATISDAYHLVLITLLYNFILVWGKHTICFELCPLLVYISDQLSCNTRWILHMYRI